MLRMSSSKTKITSNQNIIYLKINDEEIKGVESALYLGRKISLKKKRRTSRKKNNSYLEKSRVAKIHFKRSLLTPIKKQNF